MNLTILCREVLSSLVQIFFCLCIFLVQKPKQISEEMGDIEVDENAPVTLRVFNERFDQITERLNRLDEVMLELRKERERQQREFEENNAKMQQAWESGDYLEWVLVFTWIHKGDLIIEISLLHRYLTFYSCS